ncbi:MAG: transcription elongation factor GreA [Clostridia bacterium]|nr:transcription elongation factor GreA [Clostridia bacterium]MBQ3850090.1 transcription elongation factor GreA [Clostridia bacterium]MBR3460205.1 transcription elongation factor GreA [Clostridia bacterium]MBR5714573.1 transcription elongation factor GreA [Clostridia bacterium]MBR5717984.1 transcription elongation factor GreA [Clostridia bacterium]
MAEVYLTPEGKKELDDKLAYLKNIRRTEIAELISEARAQGDLSENAEYDAAKELQAKNEYEIAEVEAMLKNAIVIGSSSSNANTVTVGSTVSLRNITKNRDDEYQIVGAAEADPFKKRISNNSPVGNGLIGHKLGETVEVTTPGGVIKYVITGIK